MNIKRFVSSSMQEALKLVREELGADAVILSNERCPEGIEVVAALDYDEEVAVAELSSGESAAAEASNPSKVARLHAKRYVNLQNEMSRAKNHISNVRSESANASVRSSEAQIDAREFNRAKSQPQPAKIEVDPRVLEVRRQKRLQALHGENNPVFIRHPKSSKTQAKPDIDNQPSRTPTEKVARFEKQKPRPIEQRFSEQANTHADDQAREDLKKVQAELASLKALIQQGGIQEPSRQKGNYQADSIQEQSSQDDSSIQVADAPENLDLHADSSWIDVSLKSDDKVMRAETQRQDHQAQASQVAKKLRYQLGQLGLGEALSHELAESVESTPDFNQAWKQARTKLESLVQVETGEIIDRGGVIALVGPTGSGKTTTIGKLAARYVMKFGASSVALVTTDRYRIAAHEQLKVFGRILNVPVLAVDNQNDLDQTLDKLSDKRLVLIDTAGLLPSDTNWKQQLDDLNSSRHRVKSYLVVSAVGQYQVMRATYQQYQAAELAGSLVTKVDEAVSLGELLRFLIDSRLKVAYFADGQKVPDDIHLMDTYHLLEKAEVLLNSSERWVTINSDSLADPSDRVFGITSVS